MFTVVFAVITRAQITFKSLLIKVTTWLRQTWNNYELILLSGRRCAIAVPAKWWTGAALWCLPVDSTWRMISTHFQLYVNVTSFLHPSLKKDHTWTSNSIMLNQSPMFRLMLTSVANKNHWLKCIFKCIRPYWNNLKKGWGW